MEEATLVSVGTLKESRFHAVSLIRDTRNGQLLVARRVKDVPAGLDARLQQLPRTGIPRYVGARVNEPHTWFLFEHVQGYSLAQLPAAVPDGWILLWTFQLLLTLKELHGGEQPWVIGGLEPADVVVDDRRAWIVDLGILRRVHPEYAAMTREQAEFLPPEGRHAAAGRPQLSADVYSVGALMYWLLVGQVAHADRQTPAPEMLATIHARRPEFPLQAASVLVRLLEFNPLRRQLTAEQALEQIAPLVPRASDLPPLGIVEPTAAEVPRQPIARAAPVEEQPAPPPMTVWEDLLWQVQSHLWPIVGVAVICVMLVWGAFARGGPRPPPIITDQTLSPARDTRLAFGQGSHVLIAGGSQASIQTQPGGILQVRLLAGSTDVDVGPGDAAEVISDGYHVQGPAGSSFHVALSNGHPTVGCKRGALRIVKGKAVTVLPTGGHLVLP